MKKHLTLILVILISMVITAGCIFAYWYFTKEEVKPNIEPISKAPIYTATTYPKVDGSTSTLPLSKAFFENFTAEEVTETSVKSSKTHGAYLNLIDGKVDLILVTAPSKEELELAEKAGVELEVIPVVREGFVFYVNSKNPIDNLTSNQVESIYSGEITKWSDLGGEDIEIKAYQRPTNSGSQTGMLSLVMKNKKLMNPIKENIVETMSEIINLVSTYNNEDAAIGYSYYYYANTMFETIDSKVASNIKLLSINGIKPNNENIKSEKYPYNTSYYIVINKADGIDSPGRKLATLMLSTRGQKVAEEASYVPVK